MNIFINEVHIHLISKEEHKAQNKKYDALYEMPHADVNYEILEGKVCIENASDLLVNVIILALKQHVSDKLHSITFVVEDVKSTGQQLKKQFKILKAGGGVIKKQDRILMIYRLNKWDLPKGKKEKGEKLKQTAIREVGEECNITVEAFEKICTTWHYYALKEEDILKKTNWYAMECLDDSAMKPQNSEGIEQLIWLNKKEIAKALKNSYKSIEFVIQQYTKNTTAMAKKK